MAQNNMTEEQIQNALDEYVGETGNAKIEDGGLYVQREENSSWGFVGTVEKAAEAKKVVEQHFNG